MSSKVSSPYTSSTSSTLLRRRDFLVLFLMALGLYLTWDSASFTFTLEPAWYIDQRFKTLSTPYDIIPPVICDLNGDGNKEVVLISKDTDDLTLKVVSANAPRGAKGTIYAPQVRASVALLPLKVTKGRVPVALKTGYVDAYDADKRRSQVIVVVREDWTVICYDSQLNVLWEKAVAHKTHEMDSMIDKFTIDEVSVYLTPVALAEDVTGLVIVGGSMRLRDPATAEEAIHVEEGLGSAGETGDKEHPEMQQRAALEHFSMYALDAKTGHVVWRHDGLDVHPGQYIRGLPQHAYNLDIHDLMTKAHRASTVPDWTIFRESLIGELPHDWHGRDDTSLRMAHFERQHIGGNIHRKRELRKVNTASVASAGRANVPGSVADGRKAGTGTRQLGHIVSGTGSRFTGVETPPLAQSASLPHDAAEHTENPNVIVAHTSKGVEVVALRTGAPVTSLALSRGRSYADIDGDGIVDTLVVLENEMDVSLHGHAVSDVEESLQHCSILVTSGLPPRAKLFAGTVCSGSHVLTDSLHVPKRAPGAGGRGRKHRVDRANYYSTGYSIPTAISAASPVILKTIDPKTLLESKVRNVVVAINIGLITCYSGEGEFKWQSRQGPRWEATSETTTPSGAGTAVLFDSDASRVDDLGKHDNVHAQVLILGDDKMVIVSREGDVLTTTDLPRKPIARPVIGDFNSDGVTDVIIVTDEAILGYQLEVVQSTHSLLIALCVLCVITVIVFLANIQLSPLADAGPEGAAAAQAAKLTKLMKHSVLTIARSTDDSHID